MTIINNDKAVAAVAAPASTRSKRKYKQREPIYETSFSFTDSNIVRAKLRNGIKNDRRYDDRIPGLSLRIGCEDKITFYAWKNVPMYNRKKNTWAKNVVYKKMFVWAKNTGFNCDAARNKVAGYLDQIVDSRSKTCLMVAVKN